MNNLNFLCDIVKNSEELKVNPMDYLNKVEEEVTRNMSAENYQGSLLYPPKRFYDKAVNIVNEYFKIRK